MRSVRSLRSLARLQVKKLPAILSSSHARRGSIDRCRPAPSSDPPYGLKFRAAFSRAAPRNLTLT